MKWINPGIPTLFDEFNECHLDDNPATTNTGFSCCWSGWKTDAILIKKISATEIWFSYDFYTERNNSILQYDHNGTMFRAWDTDDAIITNVTFYNKNGWHIVICDKDKKILYTSDKVFDLQNNTIYNIEFHLKTGENGRVDVWIAHSLFCSYRSPSAFNIGDKNINKIGIVGGDGRLSDINISTSSYILQDTRRIGYEKFKMLTVDPATEQNMPQGSTTNYTVSGLSDATEFSDITSFGAIMQTTSKDANITTGTFSLNGSEIGTIDVSDSSGKAYEIAHSEINPATTKPWTRDDIEGKTLTFTVNGAS